MFSVKSSLKGSLAGLATALLLTTAGCVQTREHTTDSLMTIDYSRTYGRALTSNVAAAREAVLANPDDPAPHVFLGNAYLLTKNLDAAEAEFKIVLYLSPDSDAAYYELARINTLRGDHETALLLLNRAVELNPGFADAHLALARIHEKLGNSQEARLHRNAYIEAAKAQTEGP